MLPMNRQMRRDLERDPIALIDTTPPTKPLHKFAYDQMDPNNTNNQHTFLQQ